MRERIDCVRSTKEEKKIAASETPIDERESRKKCCH